MNAEFLWGSGISNLWQSRQSGNAEAELHIFGSPGRDKMRKRNFLAERKCGTSDIRLFLPEKSVTRPSTFFSWYGTDHPGSGPRARYLLGTKWPIQGPVQGTLCIGYELTNPRSGSRTRYILGTSWPTQGPCPGHAIYWVRNDHPGYAIYWVRYDSIYRVRNDRPRVRNDQPLGTKRPDIGYEATNPLGTKWPTWVRNDLVTKRPGYEMTATRLYQQHH